MGLVIRIPSMIKAWNAKIMVVISSGVWRFCLASVMESCYTIYHKTSKLQGAVAPRPTSLAVIKLFISISGRHAIPAPPISPQGRAPLSLRTGEFRRPVGRRAPSPLVAVAPPSGHGSLLNWPEIFQRWTDIMPDKHKFEAPEIVTFIV